MRCLYVPTSNQPGGSFVHGLIHHRSWSILESIAQWAGVKHSQGPKWSRISCFDQPTIYIRRWYDKITWSLFSTYSFLRFIDFPNFTSSRRLHWGAVGQGTGSTLDSTGPFPEPMDHQLLMAMQDVKGPGDDGFMLSMRFCWWSYKTFLLGIYTCIYIYIHMYMGVLNGI